MTPRFVVAVGLAAGALACAPNPSTCEGEEPGDCRVDSATVDGRTRTWLVSHRARLDCAQGPVPLVLAFHGAGSNGQELRGYLGLEDLLGPSALVVYPDGLPRSDTMGQTGWNRDPAGDDLRFFDLLVARLAEDPCVDTGRLFAVGHSRGGRFTEVLACHRGERHRALASIAAGTDNAATCPQRAPFWLTHGVHDQTIPYAEGLLNRDHWGTRNGCAPAAGTDFPLDACTELSGCALPVVWCPSSASEWRNHAPPAFAPTEIKAFFDRFWVP